MAPRIYRQLEFAFSHVPLFLFSLLPMVNWYDTYITHSQHTIYLLTLSGSHSSTPSLPIDFP